MHKHQAQRVASNLLSGEAKAQQANSTYANCKMGIQSPISSEHTLISL
jgi:hypothetical protein